MTNNLTIDTFLESVRQSGLLKKDEVDSAWREFEEQSVDLNDARAVARALVNRELLTTWQAENLLNGKHKGFFLGPYRFLKLLGKGGMGTVYLAQHEMMKRRCAIKVLTSKLLKAESSALERFYREAQAVAALDHPNIVRAYDVNKSEQWKTEIHYLVMEYIEGQDLQKFVEQRGSGLDYVEAAEFGRQAALGLVHAHESGLIHRDVKPANLLIDTSGTLKILDLGLARFFDDGADASLTSESGEGTLGTADYLSPEQALDSSSVDTRTDVYSLGCTFYFMLTSRPPFPEGSVAQRLISHQVKSPAPLEKFRPDVPGDLVAIIEKMIAKKPEDRYQTLGETADELSAWLEQNAGADWKQAHPEVKENASRREPTRAISHASEDTNIELGLAPLEDDESPAPASTESPTDAKSTSPVAANDPPKDGVDTQPIAPDNLFEELEEFESENPSGGFEVDLMSEPLDNFSTLSAPAGTSNTALRGRPSARPGLSQTQKLMIAALGMGIGVPIILALIVFSGAFSSSERNEQPGTLAANNPPPPAPRTHAKQSTTPTVTPANPSSAKLKTAPPKSPTAKKPNNPPPAGSAGQPQQAAPGGGIAPPTAPGPPSTPKTTAVAPPTIPTNPAAAPKDKSGKTAGVNPFSEPDSKGKSGLEAPPSSPSVDQNDIIKRRMFAAIKTVAIDLESADRNPRSKLNLTLKRIASDSLQKARIKTKLDATDSDRVVLYVKLETMNGTIVVSDEERAVINFQLSAELVSDKDGQEIVIWERNEQVASLAPELLKRNTIHPVLRTNVTKFFAQLAKDQKQAKVQGLGKE